MENMFSNERMSIFETDKIQSCILPQNTGKNLECVSIENGSFRFLFASKFLVHCLHYFI